MRVVSTKKLIEAEERYPAAIEHLQGWYQIMKQGEFYSEQSLRDAFGDMRGFNYEFRFPIPNTTLLVHTLINFESQVSLINEVKPGNH